MVIGAIFLCPTLSCTFLLGLHSVKALAALILGPPLRMVKEDMRRGGEKPHRCGLQRQGVSLAGQGVQQLSDEGTVANQKYARVNACIRILICFCSFAESFTAHNKALPGNHVAWGSSVGALLYRVSSGITHFLMMRITGFSPSNSAD